MAAAEDSMQKHIPDLYYDVPVQALQPSTRNRLGLHLNIRNDLSFNDWRYLAEKVGMDTLEIDSIKEMSTNPTESVLMRAMQKGFTVGKLLEPLLHENYERLDIFTDCGKMIEENVKAYKPLQVAEVTSGSKAPLTFGELSTGKEEFFDAFISYHVNDYEFIRTLLDKLENENGFKLCIPDRDFCVGLPENEATAVLIKNRCKRVIIVLSTSYIGMEDLQKKLKWQLQVAQTLAPVADRMHKLVPIVIDSVIRVPEDVPEVLLPYNVCDYTRPAIREWFWDRMVKSLMAPTNSSCGYKGPSGRLGTMMRNRESPSEDSEPRLRTNTEPANILAEDEDVDSSSSSVRYQRSESDVTDLSSANSREEGTSQFYRPFPRVTDSPKRKKKIRFPFSKS